MKIIAHVVDHIWFAIEHITNAIIYALMLLGIMLFMSLIVHNLIVPLVPQKDKQEISKDTSDFKDMKTKPTVYIWGRVFAAATIEEFLFRFLPLTLLWVMKVRNNLIVGTTILVSSVIFGYLHGNYLNIFLQGVGGMIYGIIFWKFMVERSQSKIAPLKAWMFVSMTHMFYNLTIHYMSYFG